MRAPRPVFVVPLAVVAAGAVAAVTVPGVLRVVDEHLRAEAVDRATALPAPDGAVELTGCHADDLIACWGVDRAVTDVAADLAARLGATDSGTLEHDCSPTLVAPDLESATCHVFLRLERGHGVFAFVDPTVDRDEDSASVVTGASVSLSAW
ncbi:hypothetical protein OMK64_13110 [Cellulomonas fimi]|uniref:hypothetical protein n=1 Tax=Cellulomonas fimi TaxID=1708 RepID=UPI00234E23B5|nr:hypothetical protein [Cellulomonas fimi]MDC7122473.1 hypothetical protein [Cellulomonas fimi]